MEEIREEGASPRDKSPAAGEDKEVTDGIEFRVGDASKERRRPGKGKKKKKKKAKPKVEEKEDEDEFDYHRSKIIQDLKKRTKKNYV